MFSTAGTFALKKYWQDAEPGIEVVEIRYVWSPPEGNPEWSPAEEARVLVPDRLESSNIRSCSIQLPRGINGLDHYDLHYYFLIVQQGRQRTSPIARERIVSRAVSFDDAEGMVSAVGVQWEVAETGAPNYTLLETDSAISGARGGARAPRSRRFTGRLWAPHGSVVEYALHIETRSKDGPARLIQMWDTNADRYRQLAMP